MLLLIKQYFAAFRNLDENEIERFIREILYDPNKPPHGLTEIADQEH